jgi:hypothetical protein
VSVPPTDTPYKNPTFALRAAPAREAVADLKKQGYDMPFGEKLFHWRKLGFDFLMEHHLGGRSAINKNRDRSVVLPWPHMLSIHG